MKTTTSLKIKRGVATLFFASLIFVSACFPKTRLYFAFAILAGCVLGSLQGAGSTGLFIIADFACNTSSLSEKSGLYIGLFFASLITGLVSGFPSPSPKINSTKKLSFMFPLRIVIGCISGLFIFYLSDIFISGNKIESGFILSDLLKVVATVIASSALRPLTAKILYPASEAEKEIEEIMNKLKKTDPDNHRGL